MAIKIDKVIDWVGNMGLRYVGFRLKHELLRRSGMLKSKFPINPPKISFITLDDWKKGESKFFFETAQELSFERLEDEQLASSQRDLLAGKFLLFNSITANLGGTYDWVTNPDTGYKYDANKHWTEIADYSAEAGDIKYVWEKSRFSYLYDIIRYDYHYSKDCAAIVFADIRSWIEGNPINCGPNYRCSQEMSLRVLNWTFALHYYRSSPLLTSEIFDEIQHVIYWHLHHIYNNIQFSRIAVRNNHAITETLALYLAGLFYPNFPDAAKWKKAGKAWFEEEIAYQLYEDGTFLQFSMNYHRIVVQLLTWGITLSEKNGERFSDIVYDRAKKSIMFLRACMIDDNGWLPNYGANDGALFFKLSNAHYRDYRPQLHALASVLGLDAKLEGDYEDCKWYGISKKNEEAILLENGTYSFPMGGYFIIREIDTLTFIKCGGYKDRPSQADNLHLDIWYKGENVLVDAGSYKYNTDADTVRYFSGTRSHNTVMLGENDQMLKGGRFIWYYWSQCLNASLSSKDNTFAFEGAINAFAFVSKGIQHRRTVVKHKDVPKWEVNDEIVGAPPALHLNQLWHVPKNHTSRVRFTSKSKDNSVLAPILSDGWSSSLYGAKEKTAEYCFCTSTSSIQTVIEL